MSDKITPVSEEDQKDLEELDSVEVCGDDKAFEEKEKKPELNKEDAAKDTVIGTQLTADGRYETIRTSLKAKPSVRNQKERYPNTVVVTGQETFVLDLSNPEDLQKLNELESDALNIDGSSEIIGKETSCHEGKWSVMLVVSYLQFQSLISQAS